MAWHTLNAFEEGDVIYLDVCQQRAPAFPSVAGAPAADADLRQYLTRWTLDPSCPDSIAIERLSDVVCEYPRIDERWCGRRYRYGYFACDGGPGTGEFFHRGIARFDHESGTMEVHHAGAHCAVAEPTFVARTPNAGEGDGFLLTTIYDETRDASDLAIFDARHVQAGPLARARLEHRVPVGFHGLWRPESG